MRIFVCHASEDKADFVRPLAAALRQHFEVWYDEYELTLGDSLVRKINGGLASCDYGVVVLSPSFFQKKWPQAELDGLFALEGTTRKMILPVWKDVSVDDVRKFSPILAGRLGANAAEGVEKVVSEIRRAVEVSDRTREISATDSIIERARQLDRTLQETRNQERLSRSEEGVSMVKAGFGTLISGIEAALNEVKKTSQVLQFSVAQSSHSLGDLFIVRANYGVALHVLLTGLGGNYTYETELHGILFKRDVRYFDQEQRANRLRELTFKPIFRLPSQLAWTDNGNRKAYSTEELASVLLEALMLEVQKQSQRSSR